MGMTYEGGGDGKHRERRRASGSEDSNCQKACSLETQSSASVLNWNWNASTFKLITILGHTNTAKWHQLTESSLKLQRFAQFEAFCNDECTMCPHYKHIT